MAFGGKLTYECLGLLYMFETKEKLAIQVTQIDCVEIDDVNFAKTGEEEVLQQFAADATGTHEKHTRLHSKQVRPSADVCAG